MAARSAGSGDPVSGVGWRRWGGTNTSSGQHVISLCSSRLRTVKRNTGRQRKPQPPDFSPELPHPRLPQGFLQHCVWVFGSNVTAFERGSEHPGPLPTMPLSKEQETHGPRGCAHPSSCSSLLRSYCGSRDPRAHRPNSARPASTREIASALPSGYVQEVWMGCRRVLQDIGCADREVTGP